MQSKVICLLQGPGVPCPRTLRDPARIAGGVHGGLAVMLPTRQTRTPREAETHGLEGFGGPWGFVLAGGGLSSPPGPPLRFGRGPGGYAGMVRPALVTGK